MKSITERARRNGFYLSNQAELIQEIAADYNRGSMIELPELWKLAESSGLSVSQFERALNELSDADIMTTQHQRGVYYCCLAEWDVYPVDITEAVQSVCESPDASCDDDIKQEAATDDLQSVEYAIEHWIPQPSGKPHSVTTIWRWRKKGLKGVRLESTNVGRQPMLKKVWLDEFFAALAAAELPPEKKLLTAVSDQEFESVGL